MQTFIIEVVSTAKRVVANFQSEAIQKILSWPNSGELGQPRTEKFIKTFREEGIVINKDLKKELLLLNVIKSSHP